MMRNSDFRERISVFILTTEYPPDLIAGLGTHVTELTGGLVRSGVKVTILTPTLSDSTVWEDERIRVHRLSLRGAMSKNGSISEVERIESINEYFAEYAEQLITNGDVYPEVIHCHDWYGFPAAYRLGRRFGIPVVSTVHLLMEPVCRWWGWTPPEQVIAIERLLCHESDALIAVSHSMRGIIVDTHNVCLQRIYVVHNGLDMRSFLKPADSDLAVNRWRNLLDVIGKKVVLFAGRINSQKGIFALLESASQVTAKYPNVRYLIAGEPDSQEFAQKVAHLLDQYHGLRDKVVLLGKVPRNQLAALYQIADLVLAPSIYEPFGYAAIEAMAAGVPVIASNVGGLKEVISHGETGLLVSVHQRKTEPHVVDIEELVAAQLTLLGDEAMTKRLGMAGRRRVSDVFNLENMIQATIAVYRNTIAAYSAGKGVER